MSLKETHCLPVKLGSSCLSPEDVAEYSKEINPVWKMEEGKKLSRTFLFTDFVESVEFVHRVADLAEQEQHHPDIHIFYNKVIIDLWTHTVGGLSKNDFIVAAKIDSMDEPV